jgi:hypothetical protein
MALESPPNRSHRNDEQRRVLERAGGGRRGRRLGQRSERIAPAGEIDDELPPLPECRTSLKLPYATA